MRLTEIQPLKYLCLKKTNIGTNFKIQDEYGRTVFKVGFELIDYNNINHNDDSDEVFPAGFIGLAIIGFGGVFLMWYIGKLGDKSNYGNNNRL